MASMTVLPHDVTVPAEARHRDGLVWVSFEDGAGGHLALHLPEHPDALIAAQLMATAYNKVAFPAVAGASGYEPVL